MAFVGTVWKFCQLDAQKRKFTIQRGWCAPRLTQPVAESQSLFSRRSIMHFLCDFTRTETLLELPMDMGNSIYSE